MHRLLFQRECKIYSQINVFGKETKSVHSAQIGNISLSHQLENVEQIIQSRQSHRGDSGVRLRSGRNVKGQTAQTHVNINSHFIFRVLSFVSEHPTDTTGEDTSLPLLCHITQQTSIT